MPAKLTREIILDRLYKAHGPDKFDYSLFVKYENIKQKIPVKCLKCNRVFYPSIDDHFRGHGCPYCSGRIKSTGDFVHESIEINGEDKYGYEEVVYIDKKTPVKIYCKTCKEFFMQTPESHLMGSGCQKCAQIRRREAQNFTPQEFIKRAKKIHGNKYDYKSVNYVNVFTPVLIFCKRCKQYFLQKPVVHIYSGCGCPRCSSSKGEQQISIFLKNKNIRFIRQYKISDCRDVRVLPFDFYLPDYNLCIEFQGEQHYNCSFYERKIKNMELAQKRFNDIQRHDKIKKEYCKTHNINFLEIRYDENIEEKLYKELKLI